MDKNQESINIVRQFTKRELQVIALTSMGKSHSQVGSTLFLSRNTVKNILADLRAKHNMTTNELIYHWGASGWSADEYMG